MTTQTRDDALVQRPLDDDLEVVLYAMAYGNTRLVLSVAGAPTWIAGWCFHDTTAALAAATEWDGEGDPDGWYRRLSDDARNPAHACTQKWCTDPSRTTQAGPPEVSAAGATVTT